MRSLLEIRKENFSDFNTNGISSTINKKNKIRGATGSDEPWPAEL
jgi:hypothetical protein